MKLLISFILVLSLFQTGYAAEPEFEVVDLANSKIIEQFQNPRNASSFFHENKEKYPQLVIRKNGKIIQANYALAKLKQNENCDYLVSFEAEDFKYKSELNACYGADAAYIETSRNLDSVTLVISGIRMIVSVDDVELINVASMDLKPSSYVVNGGKLYHNIKTQLELDYYGRTFNLQQAPDYLKENVHYFSYDGVYFYDSYINMIDDYRNKTHTQAINHKNPYYNYYMYLPHRSITNYSLEELKILFEQKWGIDSKINQLIDTDQNGINDLLNQAQIYGELEAFYQNQSMYGTNAMMLFSSSLNESEIGRGIENIFQNNLYQDAAYETEEELNKDRYQSIKDSIYAHAKHYLSSYYADVNKKKYSGSHFGNKLSGMNKDKSSDPYWGEFSASYYAKTDALLGSKDFNSYALGIVYFRDNLNVYVDEKLQDILVSISDVNNYPFVVLDELENSYLVQFDLSLFTNFQYDFAANVAYVKKEDINLLINPEKIGQRKFHQIKFDANGGSFQGLNELNLSIQDNEIPYVTKPIKNGYLFTSFDKELVPAEKNEIYIAQYMKIQSIELVGEAQIPSKDRLDLSSLKFVVLLENGETIIEDVSVDMIVNMDDIHQKQELIIQYQDQLFPVEIKQRISYQNNSDRYLELIENIQDLTVPESFELKEMVENGFNLSVEDLRVLDRKLLDQSNRFIDYTIDKNDVDLNISGLSLIHKYTVDYSRKFFIKDNVRVQIKHLDLEKQKDVQEKIIGNGYQIEDAISLSFYKNYDLLSVDSNLLISLKLKDDLNKLYTVFYVDQNKNIIKLRTTRTKSYLQFLTRSGGNFIIAKKRSVNEYDIDDSLENINEKTMANNGMKIFVSSSIILLSISLIGISYIIRKRRK